MTASAQGRSVSTLVLFTDLVFVFAVTQLTALVAVIIPASRAERPTRPAVESAS